MDDIAWKNIKILLGVTLVTGFMQGLFELIFPFFLEFRGISLVGMGLLYTITFAGDEFIQVFIGDYSDAVGRKITYSSSFIIGGIANFLFPFGRGVADISVIKQINDIGRTVRTTISSPMIFENAGKAFTRIIAWFRGGGLVIQATGYFTAFIVLQYLGFFGCFYTIALIDLIAFVLIMFYYKDVFFKKKEEPTKKSVSQRLKETYSFNITRNLKILSIIGGLFGLGNSLSHTFSLPLYFAGKYGLSTQSIALILSIHRFSMAPMLFTGPIIKKMGVKKIYPIALSIYATAFLLSSFINNLWIMVPIWLTHDMIGGSLRMPSYETLVQGLARKESRGRDTSQSLVIGEFISMFGPLVAGTLAAINWDYLFLGGAIFIYTAAIIYLTFMMKVPEIRESEES